MSNSKIYICGTHGSWKSAIAIELANSLANYTAIDGSKFCTQYIEEVFWMINPTDNDITPVMKKDIIQNALKNWLTKTIWWVIVTWHWYLVPEVYELFQHIFFVKVDPEKIYEYRINDLSRQNARPRDISTIEAIKKDQLYHFERIKLIDTSNKLRIVHNNHALHTVVSKIIDLLNE